mmetsp:Transcript_27994/g.76050  ORF Transcript_27994/g.76050 Transcript_27994/m.76050 type:complete len:250 (-) Transcript_27994:1882-2631(-)
MSISWTNLLSLCVPGKSKKRPPMVPMQKSNRLRQCPVTKLHRRKLCHLPRSRMQLSHRPMTTMKLSQTKLIRVFAKRIFPARTKPIALFPTTEWETTTTKATNRNPPDRMAPGCRPWESLRWTSRHAIRDVRVRQRDCLPHHTRCPDSLRRRRRRRPPPATVRCTRDRFPETVLRTIRCPGTTCNGFCTSRATSGEAIPPKARTRATSRRSVRERACRLPQALRITTTRTHGNETAWCLGPCCPWGRNR